MYLDQLPTYCHLSCPMSLPPVQPGPGPPAGGGRNIKAAKGRELSPSFVEKGRTGIAMTNWKWVFSWETHIQTPLANQVSTGFYSLKPKGLYHCLCTAQAPHRADQAERADGADMFTLNWKSLNGPSGPTICPSTWLPFNPLPANMVRGRKDALLLINEWSYLLFII